MLLHTTIIGAAAVTLSTSYAFGDFFGMKHSLHRSFRDAKGVYLSFAAQTRTVPAHPGGTRELGVAGLN